MLPEKEDLDELQIVTVLFSEIFGKKFPDTDPNSSYIFSLGRLRAIAKKVIEEDGYGLRTVASGPNAAGEVAFAGANNPILQEPSPLPPPSHILGQINQRQLQPPVPPATVGTGNFEQGVPGPEQAPSTPVANNTGRPFEDPHTPKAPEGTRAAGGGDSVHDSETTPKILEKWSPLLKSSQDSDVSDSSYTSGISGISDAKVNKDADTLEETDPIINPKVDSKYLEEASPSLDTLDALKDNDGVRGVDPVDGPKNCAEPPEKNIGSFESPPNPAQGSDLLEAASDVKPSQEGGRVNSLDANSGSLLGEGLQPIQPTDSNAQEPVDGSGSIEESDPISNPNTDIDHESPEGVNAPQAQLAGTEDPEALGNSENTAGASDPEAGSKPSEEASSALKLLQPSDVSKVARAADSARRTNKTDTLRVGPDHPEETVPAATTLQDSIAPVVENAVRGGASVLLDGATSTDEGPPPGDTVSPKLPPSLTTENTPQDAVPEGGSALKDMENFETLDTLRVGPDHPEETVPAATTLQDSITPVVENAVRGGASVLLDGATSTSGAHSPGDTVSPKLPPSFTIENTSQDAAPEDGSVLKDMENFETVDTLRVGPDHPGETVPTTAPLLDSIAPVVENAVRDGGSVLVDGATSTDEAPPPGDTVSPKLPPSLTTENIPQDAVLEGGSALKDMENLETLDTLRVGPDHPEEIVPTTAPLQDSITPVVENAVRDGASVLLNGATSTSGAHPPGDTVSLKLPPSLTAENTSQDAAPEDGSVLKDIENFETVDTLRVGPDHPEETVPTTAPLQDSIAPVVENAVRDGGSVLVDGATSTDGGPPPGDTVSPKLPPGPATENTSQDAALEDGFVLIDIEKPETVDLEGIEDTFADTEEGFRVPGAQRREETKDSGHENLPAVELQAGGISSSNDGTGISITAEGLENVPRTPSTASIATSLRKGDPGEFFDTCSDTSENNPSSTVISGFLGTRDKTILSEPLDIPHSHQVDLLKSPKITSPGQSASAGIEENFDLSGIACKKEESTRPRSHVVAVKSDVDSQKGTQEADEAEPQKMEMGSVGYFTAAVLPPTPQPDRPVPECSKCSQAAVLGRFEQGSGSPRSKVNHALSILGQVIKC